MITAPLSLECFEFKKRLDGGCSKPFLFAAIDKDAINKDDNDIEVVVKLRRPDSENNHFGSTSLACELICSIILRRLNVPTPDYAIVNISESLAASHLIEKDRRLLLANKGENFGTIFQRGATTWFPNSQSTHTDFQINLLENTMLFDSTVMNGDRTTGKPNIMLIGKDNSLLIDHSLALPVCRWENQDIDNSPLFPEKSVIAHCGFKPLSSKIKHTLNSFDFSKLLLNWNDVLSETDWKTIRSFIPSSWEEKHGEIDKIFRFLQNRPMRFAEISDSLRSVVK